MSLIPRCSTESRAVLYKTSLQVSRSFSRKKGSRSSGYKKLKRLEGQWIGTTIGLKTQSAREHEFRRPNIQENKSLEKYFRRSRVHETRSSGDEENKTSQRQEPRDQTGGKSRVKKESTAMPRLVGFIVFLLGL